ncbi:MAG TPA: hypothetical protein VF590_04095 [Isosphaeraceae bacterium]
MAKKRANPAQDETSASQTKAAAPKGRRTTKAKEEAPQQDAPVAVETAAKSGAPQGKAPKEAAASTKGGASKKAAAAPIKLNDKQRELLGKVKEAGESGYAIGQKIEQRTITALQERKLIKRGAKNKETGNYHYLLTKLGEKQLTRPEATA